MQLVISRKPLELLKEILHVDLQETLQLYNSTHNTRDHYYLSLALPTAGHKVSLLSACSVLRMSLIQGKVILAAKLSFLNCRKPCLLIFLDYEAESIVYLKLPHNPLDTYLSFVILRSPSLGTLTKIIRT